MIHEALVHEARGRKTLSTRESALISLAFRLNATRAGRASLALV